MTISYSTAGNENTIDLDNVDALANSTDTGNSFAEVKNTKATLKSIKVSLFTDSGMTSAVSDMKGLSVKSMEWDGESNTKPAQGSEGSFSETLSAGSWTANDSTGGTKGYLLNFSIPKSSVSSWTSEAQSTTWYVKVSYSTTSRGGGSPTEKGYVTGTLVINNDGTVTYNPYIPS